MIKYVVLVAVCYILYRLFMNDRNKKAEKEQNVQEKQVEAGELVRDPTCGTYVEKENSISVRNGEHVEHFCSTDCREQYIKRIEEQNKIS